MASTEKNTPQAPFIDSGQLPPIKASDSTSHRTSGASHQSAEGLAGGSLYRREASFSYIAERLAVLSDEHPAALGPDQGDETPRRELRHCRAFSSGGAEDVNGCDHHMGRLAWDSVN